MKCSATHLAKPQGDVLVATLVLSTCARSDISARWKADVLVIVPNPYGVVFLLVVFMQANKSEFTVMQRT